MQKFQEITELDPIALELLQAIGIEDEEALKDRSIAEICEEMSRVNSLLEITDEELSEEQVKEWLKPIEAVIGEIQEVELFEADQLIPESALLMAKFAVPLSKEFVEKNEIDAHVLPLADLKFTTEEAALEYLGQDKVTLKRQRLYEMERAAKILEEQKLKQVAELEMTVPISVKAVPKKEEEPIVEELTKESTSSEIESAPAPALEPTKQHNSPYKTMVDEIEVPEGIEIDELLLEKPEPGERTLLASHYTDHSNEILDKKRIRSMDKFREEGSHVAPLNSVGSSDLTRTVKKETNKGIDPNSRRYVKGVLHKHAGSFKIGVFGFLFALLCILAGFAASLLVFIDRDKFWWAGFGPVIAIFGVLLYFMSSSKASCPICNQKQFRPKNCLKHRNAHHWGLLGYMIPTAIHSVLFKWFRCIFCGTSVRLKE